uniref:Uncharacterized protein n=1 Tax=Noctiluca scintillans TaxID=2966 RepID=A0A7S1F8S9_NOCSC|mmetsp:Transcript_4085/g.11479  ORF Transcript_4085/g.11479 Transcript_4085/m.11479 type:complete len:309 (+) Transcript_4085:83-1009(+)
MSDDAVHGYVLHCIPRRLFTFWVAFLLFLRGMVEIGYLLVVFATSYDSHYMRDNCFAHGGSRCAQNLSCHGSMAVTYHVGSVVYIGGGLVFGFCGMLGTITNRPEPLLRFWWYLRFYVYFLTATILLDFLFLFGCDAYPQGMVFGAVNFPVPNLPVSEGFKNQLQLLSWFPRETTEEFTNCRLWAWYLLNSMITWWSFSTSADSVHIQASLDTYGTIGLGPNHNLHTWKQQLSEETKWKTYLRESRERLAATWQDVAWDPDELAEGPPKHYTAWGPRPGEHPIWQRHARPSGYGADDVDDNRSKVVEF